VEARECLQRGTQWMHPNGLVEEAVNCMIRAQDWEQAGCAKSLRTQGELACPRGAPGIHPRTVRDVGASTVA
jgi:hypothetical protein